MATQLHTDTSHPALPTELWHLIISHLNKRTLKKLRMVNRLVHSITTPIIFRTVRFDLTEELTIRNLIHIASHKQLRKHVKRLVLHRRHGLRDLVGIFHFEALLTFPDTIGQGQSTPEHENMLDDEELMSRSEWNGLEENEQVRLYLKYDVEQLKIHAQSCMMALHWYEQVCERPGRRGKVLGQALKAKEFANIEANIGIEEFDIAILALENLEEFLHVPIRNDMTWSRRWGRLQFDTKSNVVSERDKHIESLQLAISLSALGEANSTRRGLRSLKLHLPGQAYYGPHMILPWCAGTDIVDGYRKYRSNFDATMLCLDGYTKRLSAAKLSFLYLTQLDCIFDTIQDINNNSEILLGFFELVEQSSDTLESLNLSLNDSRVKYPTDAYSKGVCGNEFLTKLPKFCKPWKKLARVELEVFTDVATIMKFLTYVAPTLRELRLNRVRIPESGGTLQELVTQIGQNLHQLRILEIFESGSPPFIWTETVTFDR